MLTLTDINNTTNQIWLYRKNFGLWIQELNALRKKLESFDDSKEDRYIKVIKPYTPNVSGIELESLWDYTSRVIPQFHGFVPPRNTTYIIKEHIIGKDYKKLQLEIYFKNKDWDCSKETITQTEINNLRNQIPEEYYSAKQLNLVLGKLFNRSYENLPNLESYKLALKYLEKDEAAFFKSKGLTFVVAIRDRTILKEIHSKYKAIISKYSIKVKQIKELEEKLCIQQKMKRNPYTITFQWWDLEEMKLAFPPGSKDKTGIWKVRKMLPLEYPNLVLFKTKEELYVQLGIQFIQAKLLTLDAEIDFRKEFYNIYIKRKNLDTENDINLLHSVVNSAIDKIRKIYPYRLGAFWSYVDNLYRIALVESGYYLYKKQNIEEGYRDPVDSGFELDPLKLKDSKNEYSVQDTCNILGITNLDKVYKWLQRHNVQGAVKQGRKWIINDIAIQEIKKLADKSKSRINWKSKDGDFISKLSSEPDNYELLVQRYVQKYKVSEESAQRTLRRLIKEARNGNDKAKWKIEELLS